MGDQRAFRTFERTDYTFERGSDIGEIGNTTADDKDLAIGARRWTSDQIHCSHSSTNLYCGLTEDSRIVLAYSYV